MKKGVALFALASFIMITGIANAETTGVMNVGSEQTNLPNVYVAKDVTDQNNYKVTYKSYDSSNHLVSIKEVKPKKGSLVQFIQEPLSEAISNQDHYVSLTPDIALLNKNLEDLHKDLYSQLNPSSMSDMYAASIQPNIVCQQSTTASGSFSAYNATIQYAIDYNTKNQTCQINPTFYSVWQSTGTGSAWLTHYDWYNYSQDPNSTAVPYGYASAIHPYIGLDWYGPTGYNFTTVVQGSNLLGTHYSGYTMLY